MRDWPTSPGTRTHLTDMRKEGPCVGHLHHPEKGAPTVFTASFWGSSPCNRLRTPDWETGPSVGQVDHGGPVRTEES